MRTRLIRISETTFEKLSQLGDLTSSFDKVIVNLLKENKKGKIENDRARD